MLLFVFGELYTISEQSVRNRHFKQNILYAETLRHNSNFGEESN